MHTDKQKTLNVMRIVMTVLMMMMMVIIIIIIILQFGGV